MQLSKSIWNLVRGEVAWQYVLDNGHMRVAFTNYGAIITEISQLGTGRNLVLSYDDPGAYLTDPYYLGCVVGRFANRLRDGRFQVDNRNYQLSINEAENNNHLHGGFEGLGRKLFEVVAETQSGELLAVHMQYTSEAEEEGYPGTAVIQVTYSLCQDNTFTIRYHGQADEATLINLTQHTYFTLSSQNDVIPGAWLKIAADRYMETGERFLPTGAVLPVSETRYDFSDIRQLYSVSSDDYPLYNTYFLLDEDVQPCVWVQDDERKVEMQIRTDLPGVLLYTGDYLDKPFRPRQGFCLEFQYPPDAPNQEGLPSAILRPGEVYDHYISYHFKWNE